MKTSHLIELYGGDNCAQRLHGEPAPAFTLEELTTVNSLSEAIEEVDRRTGDDLAEGFKYYRHALFGDYDEQGLNTLRRALKVSFEEETDELERCPDSHWLIDELSKQKLVSLMITFTAEGLTRREMVDGIEQELNHEATVLDAIKATNYTPQGNGSTLRRLEFSAAVAKRKMSLLQKAQESFGDDAVQRAIPED